VGSKGVPPFEILISYFQLQHDYLKIAFNFRKDNHLFTQHQPWKQLSEQAMIGKRRRRLDTVADDLKILN